MFLSKLFIRRSAGPEGLPPVEGGAVEGADELFPRKIFTPAYIGALEATLRDRVGVDVNNISPLD